MKPSAKPKRTSAGRVKEPVPAYGSRKLTSFSLFSGAGGLDMGVEAAGFMTVACVEFERNAADTLRYNAERRRSGLKIVEADIRNVYPLDLAKPGIDLLHGGPPCQPFSIGGKHGGFKDQRDMFPEAARVVRAIQPKAFIFENVRGLLRESFAKYFQYILLQLKYPEIAKADEEDWTKHLARLEEHHTHGRYKGLYYRALFRLVNAADYGIPQKRERVIIVGFRSDVCEDWSFPTPTHSEHSLLRTQYVTGEYWERHEIAKRNRPALPDHLAGKVDNTGTLFADNLPWLTVRDAIADLPDPRTGEAATIVNHRFQPGAKAYPGHTGSPLDEPAKTLKAGDHGVPGGENMLVQTDGTLRYFTVREAARLQTFPDWYVFRSSWTESMRQIGNAVPVRLASVVAASVADRIRRFDERKAS